MKRIALATLALVLLLPVLGHAQDKTTTVDIAVVGVVGHFANMASYPDAAVSQDSGSQYKNTGIALSVKRKIGTDVTVGYRVEYTPLVNPEDVYILQTSTTYVRTITPTTTIQDTSAWYQELFVSLKVHETPKYSFAVLAGIPISSFQQKWPAVIAGQIVPSGEKYSFWGGAIGLEGSRTFLGRVKLTGDGEYYPYLHETFTTVGGPGRTQEAGGFELRAEASLPIKKGGNTSLFVGLQRRDFESAHTEQSPYIASQSDFRQETQSNRGVTIGIRFSR